MTKKESILFKREKIHSIEHIWDDNKVKKNIFRWHVFGQLMVIMNIFHSCIFSCEISSWNAEIYVEKWPKTETEKFSLSLLKLVVIVVDHLQINSENKNIGQAPKLLEN